MKIFQGEELPQPKSMLLVSFFFLPPISSTSYFWFIEGYTVK